MIIKKSLDGSFFILVSFFLRNWKYNFKLYPNKTKLRMWEFKKTGYNQKYIIIRRCNQQTGWISPHRVVDG